MWRIRYFFKRIRNLIVYFPIVWKDEEWDNVYLNNLIIFKIKKIKKTWEKIDKDPNGIGHVGMEDQIRWMNVVIRLLERASDEYYENESLNIGESPDSYCFYIARHQNDYRRTVKYLQKKSHSKKEISPERVLLHIGYLRDQRALNLAYRIIAWNSPRWWL